MSQARFLPSSYKNRSFLFIASSSPRLKASMLSASGATYKALVNGVYLPVGSLRRKYRRYQQLKRAAEVKPRFASDNAARALSIS
jgi:hypothetical protein